MSLDNAVAQKFDRAGIDPFVSIRVSQFFQFFDSFRGKCRRLENGPKPDKLGLHAWSHVVSRREIHDENRDSSRFENELINQRLTWFGTLQGLLLAALAFAWKDAPAIVIVLGALGLLVAVSVGIATNRANKRLDQFDPDNRKGPGWPLMPGRVIPWAFAAGWVAILGRWCGWL